MEQSTESQAWLARVNTAATELRKSEAYPAIVGGVAGGIAGALMAVIIAGALAPRQRNVPVEANVVAQPGKPPFAVRDLIQLITIGATLIKQIQALRDEKRK
jgi:hypothetical protein